MLKQIVTAPSAPTVWLVQLRLELARMDGRSPSEDDVEPMVELVGRTHGIRDVAVVPLEAGVAVAVSLVAADATTALQRAGRLAVSAARYAGLGVALIARARVLPVHRPEMV
jgi:hypothetical protein